MLKNLEKLGADASSMQMLQAAYDDAPDAVKGHLNRCALEILLTELPKLQLLVEYGPALPVDKMHPIADMFESAVKLADKKAPRMAKQLTATVRDAAVDIASAIDKAFRRVLLTDTDANHEAYVTAMHCHAKIVKCVAGIALTEEQKAILAEHDDAKPTH